MTVKGRGAKSRRQKEYMDVKTLQPNRSIIKTEGNLSYGESVQGWNTIRLKKELINEFTALKEKSSKFSYTLTFYRTYEELENKLMPFGQLL